MDSNERKMWITPVILAIILLGLVIYSVIIEK